MQGKTIGKWTARAARALAAGAIAFSMGGGACLVQGAQRALADDTPGEVTIYLSANDARSDLAKEPGPTTKSNHDTRFLAYRIFYGDVGYDTSETSRGRGAVNVGKADNDTKKITNVQWGSKRAHDVIAAFIEKWNSEHQADDGYDWSDPIAVNMSDEGWEQVSSTLKGESAMAAAEYIANHIGAGSTAAHDVAEGAAGRAGDASRGNPNQDFALVLESAQFGSELAALVKNDEGLAGLVKRGVDEAAGGTLVKSLVPSTTYQFDDGWYLFVTDPGSMNKESQTATSPIFAVVGGAPVTVTEKDSVPTVDKQVKDDSRSDDAADAWGMAADANAGQALKFRLTGTIASNAHSYNQYYYQFNDTCTDAMKFDAKTGRGSANGNARVWLHKASYGSSDPSYAQNARVYDVTENFYFTVDKRGEDAQEKTRLRATCGNLRKLAVTDVTKSGPAARGAYQMVAGDYLTLEYSARIAPDGAGSSDAQGTSHGTNVVQGGEGNSDTATVTYSNDPKRNPGGGSPTDSADPTDPDAPEAEPTEVSDPAGPLPGTGTSAGSDVRVYTYSLRLHKQDKQNAARQLAGAKFTLQVKTADDPSASGVDPTFASDLSVGDVTSRGLVSGKTSQGLYVQADGSLGEEPHEFTTDANGNLLVKNLDVGTYILHESQAPVPEQGGVMNGSGNAQDTYEPIDDCEIVISSNVHEAAGAKTSVANVQNATHSDGTTDEHLMENITGAAGSGYAVSGTDQRAELYVKETGAQVLEMSSSVSLNTGFGHNSTVTATDSVDSSGSVSGDGVHVTATTDDGGATGAKGTDGNVSVVVREAKETNMPLTGGAGIAAFAVAGGALIALGAALLRRRGREDADDQATA